MTSSLASQLKRIRLPTAAEDVSKGRVSLLFDARQAADIGLDTVFSIGVNGLAELRTLNDKFAPFEKTLFSESTKGVDRALQTKDVNDSLDASIRRFMRLLSPYFLLKPAQKALEWLIRRFRVHEMNQEAVLEAILPYHETKLFVRVVQILSLDGRGMARWAWLEGVQKNGVPLSRDALVQRCASDLSLVAFIGDAVVAASSGEVGGAGRHLISFYAATVVALIEAAGEVSEALVQLLLPYVLAGLKASSVDLVVATCMVVAQLARRAPLAEALVGTVLDALCLHASTGGCPLRHALTCCVLVCQAQTLRDFPVRGFRLVARLPSFVDDLAEVAAAYDATAFVDLLARRFVGHMAAAADYRDTLARLISIVPLSAAAALTIAQGALAFFVAQTELLGGDAQAAAAVGEGFGELVRALDLRHPAALDATVESQMQRATDDAGRARVHAFVSLSVRGVRHAPVEGPSTTMFLSLNHSQPSVRLLAVRQLSADLKGARRSDAEFVSEALLARLADDDRAVVSAVLDIGKELVSSVPAAKLLAAIGDLLERSAGSAEKRRKTLLKAVSIAAGPLAQSHPALADAVVSTILPRMFATAEAPRFARAVVRAVAASHISSHPLLVGIPSIAASREFADDENGAVPIESIAAGNALLARALARSLAAAEVSSKWLDLVTALVESSAQRHGRLLAWLVLAAVSASGGDVALDAARRLASALTAFVEREVGVAQRVAASAQPPSDGHVAPPVLLAHACGQGSDAAASECALALSLLYAPVDATASDSSSAARELVRTLFAMLAGARDAQLFAPHVKRLVAGALDGAPLVFLRSVWTSEKHGLEHARALLLADAYIRSFAGTSTDFQALLPALFVGLASPAKSVRAASVRCAVALELAGGPALGAGRATPYAREALSAGQPAGLAGAHVARLLTALADAAELMADDVGHVARVLHAQIGAGGDYGKAVGAYVASQAVAAGEGRLQHCLLALVRGVGALERLPIVVPLLSSLLSRAETAGYESLSGHARAAARAVLDDFGDATLPLIATKPPSESRQNPFVEALVHALAVGDAERSLDSPQGVALARITPTLFGSLPSRAQKAVFGAVCDVATDATGYDVGAAALVVLRAVPVPASVLVHELSRFGAAEAARQSPQDKRARRTEAKADDERRGLARATVVLELLQTKENVDDVHRLVPPLFDVLGHLLDGRASLQAQQDYPRQLALGALTAACRLGGADVDPSSLKMDAVVQCVRVSDNPQTHHHALLLLATLAETHPDRVLQNIMPIFTFMGANVLRQDDNYSFHVIQRTIETVIPPLVAGTGTRDGASTAEVVVGVLRVFVDAVAHIPSHRRLRLFAHLVRTLGASQFLSAVVALLLEKAAGERTADFEGDGSSKPSAPAAPDTALGVFGDLALALVHQMDAVLQLATAGELVRLLLRLPHEKPVEEARGRKATPAKTTRAQRAADGVAVPDALLFDVEARSARHLRQFKHVGVAFVSALLSSRPFLSAVRGVDAATTEAAFLALLESLLSLSASIAAFAAKATHDESDQPQQRAAHVRFWRMHVGARTYDAIDKVNGLLAIPAFVGVVSRLLSHRDGVIRRKVLALFTTRLSDAREGAGPRKFSAADTEALLGMVPTLLACVGEGAGKDAAAVNRQTALLGIDLLARAFAQRHPDPFVAAMPVVMGSGAMGDNNPQVVASGIVCVATLCGELGARVLAFLPTLVPKVLASLDNSLSGGAAPAGAEGADAGRRKEKERAESAAALLQMSAVTAVGVLLGQVPQFLSPYLPALYGALARRELAGQPGAEGAHVSSAVLQKAASVRKLAATAVPTRLAVPALVDAVTTATAGVDASAIVSAAPALCALAGIAEDACTAMAKEDVPVHHKTAFKAILAILDVRTRVQADGGAAEGAGARKGGKSKKAHAAQGHDADERVRAALAAVEARATDALVALVMRLSENTFRPLFARLCEWATAEAAPPRRLLPFFAAVETLARRLRSLFVPFAGGIVSACVDLLAANTSELGRPAPSTYAPTFPSDEGAGDALLSAIAGALEQCFLHDSAGTFLTKDRFDALLRPLVDQLDNGLGGAARLESRGRERIVPCLAQMAVAAGNDALWKSLNNSVLLKTRSADAKVRYAALQAVHEFYRRIGEPFLVLLPETIPFLAELMEDEDADVERLCQETIATIETYLGESLQTYF